MKNFIAKAINFIIRSDKNDPVKHCQVYRTFGCAHVDGFLCNMDTCNISVRANFKPRKVILIEPSYVGTCSASTSAGDKHE